MVNSPVCSSDCRYQSQLFSFIESHENTIGGIVLSYLNKMEIPKKYIYGTLPFTALQVNRNYDDFRCRENRKFKKRSIGHLWSILKWKVEEHNVYNIHQLHDVVMEEWKRTPVATCEALVNSMLKRVKAVSHMKIYLQKYYTNVRDVLRVRFVEGDRGGFPPSGLFIPASAELLLSLVGIKTSALTSRSTSNDSR